MKLCKWNILLSAGLILTISCGCRHEMNMLAASGAANDSGGIYRITGSQAEQILFLPSVNYLTASADGRNFYASLSRIKNHKRSGGIAHLQKRADNTLELIKTIPSPAGHGPCHLTLSPDEKYIYTANYGGGSFAEYKLENKHLTDKVRIIRHSGKSIHRRQRSPHPHFAAFDPLKNQLYICDLGTDEIFIYNYTPQHGIEQQYQSKLTLPPGSGPRHLIFASSGLVLLTANELNSTVSSFTRSSAESPWQLKMSSSTLFSGTPAKNNYPGAIKLSADDSIFLVTNRGDNSIALFELLENGRFKLRSVNPAGGDYPYDIAVDKDNRQIAVLNMKSNNLCRFVLTADGKLQLQSPMIALPRGMALLSQ